jgi:galactonate dehydratase
VREKVRVYGWIGGDHPRDVTAAAQERKAQGFTAVKMNGTGSNTFASSFPPHLHCLSIYD